MNISKIVAAAIHLLCQIPGSVLLAKHTALELASRGSHEAVEMHAWMLVPATPQFEIFVAYALLFVSIGSLTLLGAYAARGGGVLEIGTKGFAGLIGYELLCAVILANVGMMAGWAMWLIFVAGIPLLFLSGCRWSLAPATDRLVAAACIGILGGVMIYLYATDWNPSLRFLNDYSDLDEQTVLDDGRVVSNLSFLAEYRIPGKFAFDPCAESGRQGPGACLQLARPPFSNPRLMFELFPPGRGLSYDWDNQVLRVFHKPTAAEAKLIDDLWGGYPDSLSLCCNWTGRELDSDFKDFLKRNRTELDGQRFLGRFFFHHAFLFLPALDEARMGERRLPAQYGSGLTTVLAAYFKAKPNAGFQDYYALYGLAVGAYLLLLGLLIGYVSRSVWIGIAGFALSLFALLAVSPAALRMAPGFNPVRHFPDLLGFVLVALDYRYRTWITGLLRAIAIAVLIWWNREFGLFFLVGSLSWQFLELMETGVARCRLVARMVLEVAIAIATMAYFKTATINDLAVYNLMGIGAPQTEALHVVMWLALWAPAILTLVWARFLPARCFAKDRPTLATLDLAGVALIYVAVMTIYALWNPSRSHIAVIWLSAVVPFVLCFDKAACRLPILSRYTRPLRRYLAICSSLAVAGLATYYYIFQYRPYDAIFRTHRAFEWQLPALAGQGTADPTPLAQSLRLIEKYQPNGRIIVVSRFDVLIYLASGRQGLLPYVDLPSSVVSWEMIDRIASRIDNAKPPLLFVDRDIGANKEWSAVYQGEGGLPAPEDAHRIGSWAALAQLFRSISSCYAAGESSGLLQVWHRTCE